MVKVRGTSDGPGGPDGRMAKANGDARMCVADIKSLEDFPNYVAKREAELSKAWERGVINTLEYLEAMKATIEHALCKYNA